MARIEAPKSSDYDSRATERIRKTRITVLLKRPQMTQPEKDEALKLLLEDYAARNIQA